MNGHTNTDDRVPASDFCLKKKKKKPTQMEGKQKSSLVSNTGTKTKLQVRQLTAN